MPEIIVNLHMHTRYSDGSGSHGDIVEAARKADIDVVIVTDHNLWVNGLEDYYGNGTGGSQKPILLLVGEEIHDRTSTVAKNHLLVFNANQELANLASDPQKLIDGVNKAGGQSFIAHPFEKAAPLIGEPDIPWQDWNVQGYTGIELWNGFSEYKGLLRNWLQTIYYAFNFGRIAHGPYPETLAKWDELLQERRVVAIGGTDAHALQMKLWLLKRVIFPYEKHFRTINTHLIIPQELTGDVVEDKAMIFDAFRQGHAFVGNDWPAATRWFTFTAQGMQKSVIMGDTIEAKGGVTLQIRVPRLASHLHAECRLLKDGAVIKVWHKSENCTHIITEPGVYRVEVYLPFYGKKRGWIFSNPIYVR